MSDTTHASLSGIATRLRCIAFRSLCPRMNTRTHAQPHPYGRTHTHTHTHTHAACTRGTEPESVVAPGVAAGQALVIVLDLVVEDGMEDVVAPEPHLPQPQMRRNTTTTGGLEAHACTSSCQPENTYTYMVCEEQSSMMRRTTAVGLALGGHDFCRYLRRGPPAQRTVRSADRRATGPSAPRTSRGRASARRSPGGSRCR
jgi:hypothetical protein